MKMRFPTLAVALAATLGVVTGLRGQAPVRQLTEAERKNQ